MNQEAELCGVAPGMALANACALVRTLAVVPAAPQADAALLERLARWCERYTPWVAVEGQAGLWLDVTGCSHLFGGEPAMLDDLLARLGGFGFAVRGALADAPGAAWALSRCGDNAAIVPAGETRDALARLPIQALRLNPAVAEELSRLGLRRIGDLLTLPRGSLAARFGKDVLLRLDQALDIMDEPISPRRHVEPYRVRRIFSEPIGTAESIARAVDGLLNALCERLERDRRGCRRLELVCYRVDGAVQSARVGTVRPVRDPRRLACLFDERLGDLDPGFGIEAMVLFAPVTEPLAPLQSSLVCEEASSDTVSSDLAALMDRLGNRLGFGRVLRVIPVETHIPERAYRTVTVNQLRTHRPWPKRPVRPLHLLRRPEPIETVTLLPPGEPGDPPALFRWRRARHRVRRAEGPERITPEWRRGDPAWREGPRDYWRVEDEAGRCFWIYREGPLRPGKPSPWFLHGLFG